MRARQMQVSTASRAGSLGLLGLAAGAFLSLTAGACNWMEFDDIAKDTWVDTTGAPGGISSSDFALAVAEANNELASPAETKQLAVISRSDLTLAFLSYDADGKLNSRQTIGLSTASAGPFDSLPASPIYASDPRSGRVAVTALGKLAVGDPSRSTIDSVMLGNSANSAGVAFLESGGKTYVMASTERGTFAVDLSVSPLTATLCTAPTAITRVVALGATLGATGQLVMWYQNAPMMRAELAVHTVAIAGATCTLTAVPGAYLDLSLPNRDQYPLIEGARIVAMPEGDAMAISDPIKGQVTLHKVAMLSSVSTISAPDVAALTVGKIGADTYVVSGAPNQDIDGVANAGRVLVTKVTAGTPAATPELTLFDASPDTEQRFGRAVALLPFADAASPIVVVGADDELFSYFRTSLYGERRAR